MDKNAVREEIKVNVENNKDEIFRIGQEIYERPETYWVQ